MSKSIAIAAATATLRALLLSKMQELDASLSDLDVTIQPPDLARKNTGKPQLNLYLYHTALNSAWRNMDLPSQSRPGERGQPPLALNLYYMITAYAREDNDNLDLSGHRVLGSAMSVLHDYPILKRADIDSALPNSELALQLERVRITPQPLSVDEIYKLWTAYQSPYRISAAYELTVALIDSSLSQAAALPVLQRGAGDKGVVALAAAEARLNALRSPNRQPAGRLGEELVIVGERLRAPGSVVRFDSLRGDARVELAARAGAAPEELVVRLPASGPAPDDPLAFTQWAPGFYALSVITCTPDTPDLASNQLGFSLAPSITVSPLNVVPGSFVLTITCTPQLRDGQHVRLLFGNRQVAPKSVLAAGGPALPTTLTFQLTGVTAGTYLARLRVDGVDSMPVLYSGGGALPSFDPNQQVTVAP